MNGGQGNAEPAIFFVLAEQHHGRAFRVGEPGEKFSLADKFVSGADDRLLVDGRGDKRIQFAPETAFRAIPQRRDGGVRGRRRTRSQIFRQWLLQWICDEEPAGVAVTGKIFQRQTQSQFLVEVVRAIRIADEQIFRVVFRSFGGDGFEGDFGADAGHVTQ